MRHASGTRHQQAREDWESLAGGQRGLADEGPISRGHPNGGIIRPKTMISLVEINCSHECLARLDDCSEQESRGEADDLGQWWGRIGESEKDEP